ncbi:MAG: helix-turn-helix domain-containing protein [candidate division NC10 bacterium]|nr:helix-turn-helix domain-containing protein [candidate division NC10 bacterium]
MEKKSAKKLPVTASKRYYTTSQAAKICGLSHRTIAKLFDAGAIKGYRLPGSGFRRIPEKEMLSFIASCGMPASGMLASPKGQWLHCWEYRTLHKQTTSLCKGCEVRLSHIRYCWRLSESGLPVCRYRDGDCRSCRYFVWASPLAEEISDTKGR